jgi:hypothetical protein
MILHYGARTAEADRKYVIAYLLIERYGGVVRKPDQALLLGLFVTGLNPTPMPPERHSPILSGSLFHLSCPALLFYSPNLHTILRAWIHLKILKPLLRRASVSTILYGISLRTPKTPNLLHRQLEVPMNFSYPHVLM